jgi:uncharacterized OB-fold protein
MKQKNSRPLPSMKELDTREFWQFSAAKEFRYQQCAQCSEVVWYPRNHCPGCLDGELEWQLASGLGEVYSYSIVRQSYHPFFRNLVPYVVAWVDLVEGPRLLTNVVECDVEAVSVGMPVEITWETHEEVSIPLVRKAPAME